MIRINFRAKFSRSKGIKISLSRHPFPSRNHCCAILRNDEIKRLFRFPVSSNYLEKGLECKLAQLQDTSSAAGGLKEEEATGGLVGGVKAESSGNIYFPYQFLHGESSNTRAHVRLVRVDGPNLKPVLRGSTRYFIGWSQRTPLSRQSYARICTSRWNKGRRKN